MAAKQSDSFKITPHATISLRYSELNFSNLYLHHAYSAGPNAAQGTIILANPAACAASNWPSYGGLGPDAKLVAQAHGMQACAGGKWHCCFSIAFTNERFKGSSLQVMGISVKDDHWAIVGGTSEFKLASGVIYKKLHELAIL